MNARRSSGGDVESQMHLSIVQHAGDDGRGIRLSKLQSVVRFLHLVDGFCTSLDPLFGLCLKPPNFA